MEKTSSLIFLLMVPLMCRRSTASISPKSSRLASKKASSEDDVSHVAEPEVRPEAAESSTSGAAFFGAADSAALLFLVRGFMNAL
jgi:hypothetical protein